MGLEENLAQVEREREWLGRMADLLRRIIEIDDMDEQTDMDRINRFNLTHQLNELLKEKNAS